MAGIRIHTCQKRDGGLESNVLATEHCPACSDFKSSDHASIARRENAVTRILAQALPNLSEVRWLNRWAFDRRGEAGQLGTRIVREDNQIVLLRDDGQEV